METEAGPQDFPEFLDRLTASLPLPKFLSDLARLEWALFQVASDPDAPPHTADTIRVNPTLKLVPTGWKHLDALLKTAAGREPAADSSTEAHVMIWKHPLTGRVHVREADDADLLSLKITVEQTEPETAAALGGIHPGTIDNMRRRSIAQGILISPPSQIRRKGPPADAPISAMQPFLAADTFTLQWHITQACDLHCKHCYDRSRRPSLPLDAAVAILDDFYRFCREMQVRGQISFTGGNPLLYPHFKDIYKEAADRGFGAAILGNPTPPQEVEELLAIAKPAYFQISLEGLEAHNDRIRGNGHFRRSLTFLEQLRSLDIYTMVMLTLTHDNIHQVLPLAEELRDRTDFFTFNRLSTVGEGARLLMAEPAAFQTFLRQYLAASRQNPVMGYKDNLINVLRHENGRKPFGGCTGYGCGAAFNFVALLADGEVHACRKFPSIIGNITQSRLTDIYHSKKARQYRTGSRACHDCRLNVVCRGCPAITHSYGLDVFKEKDPYCFMPSEEQ